METTLQEGMDFEFTYQVPADKTVPHLYPEFDEGRQMHIEWPRQQTVGIHINASHTAATPPGFTVTVRGRLEKIDGRKLRFALEAHDGVDAISKGTHDRFIIDADKFNAGVEKKKNSA